MTFLDVVNSITDFVTPLIEMFLLAKSMPGLIEADYERLDFSILKFVDRKDLWFLEAVMIGLTAVLGTHASPMHYITEPLRTIYWKQWVSSFGTVKSQDRTVLTFISGTT